MKYKLPTDYTSLEPKEKRIVRELYIKLQKNKCYFCKGSLNEPALKEITDKKINWDLFPKGFLDYPIHLQHSHETNMTEGAVHNYCNAVMWQYHGR